MAKLEIAVAEKVFKDPLEIWILPEGIEYFDIEGCGGGGGGGGGGAPRKGAGPDANSAGGGGGGGGSAPIQRLRLKIPDTGAPREIIVAIAAGGMGGPAGTLGGGDLASGQPGSRGDSSSINLHRVGFGSVDFAGGLPGGGGALGDEGQPAKGGTGGGIDSPNYAGWVGGNGTFGESKAFKAGAGGTSWYATGGSGGTAVEEGGGAGGGGGGGFGRGGDGGSASSGSPGANAPPNSGAGGGGGSGGDNSNGQHGGNGGSGFVRITWTILACG